MTQISIFTARRSPWRCGRSLMATTFSIRTGCWRGTNTPAATGAGIGMTTLPATAWPKPGICATSNRSAAAGSYSAWSRGKWTSASTASETNALEDYQRYSGIHFALRLAQSYTLEGRFPPNPEVYGLEEWQARCTKEFETTIALHRRDLPERSDFDFWYVGVHDGNGCELYRHDLPPDQIGPLLTMAQPAFKFGYRAVSRAATWTVWPHSRRDGWLNKITGQVMV